MASTWLQKSPTILIFMQKWTQQNTREFPPTRESRHCQAGSYQGSAHSYSRTSVSWTTGISTTSHLQILATFWAFWLPPVQYGIYFHRRTSVGSPTLDKQLHHNSSGNLTRSNMVEASTLIARHARSAYTRPKVLAWSGLYAVALALFVQAQTYMQLLWKQIQEESNSPVAYNGAVEAAQTLLGAGGAFAASILASSGIPAPVAAVQGVAVFIATFFGNVFVSYAGYIVMGMLFHYTITLASAKIAGQLSDESCFGLIFGINTLVGTGLQSILTLVLIQTLKLPIASQYFAISGLYLLLASVWLLGWMINMCRQKQTINVNNQY